jgi:ribosome-associated translation inhibitor RaiA
MEHHMEQSFEPSIVVRGPVSTAALAYALEKLHGVVDALPGPVRDVELKLDHHSDPARQRPYHVQLSVRLDGRVVRAHRSAETMNEAVDRAAERLRRQVEAGAERGRTRRRRHSEVGSWHHEDRPTERPNFFPRPEDERELVRRKTFALEPESIEEAVLDLEALDHDFYLFVNDETGEENVVERLEGGYVVYQPTPTPRTISGLEFEVRSGPHPAEMDVTRACEVLDGTAAPFVFFVDSASRRGQVVYRRYDGHYGLITPS